MIRVRKERETETDVSKQRKAKEKETAECWTVDLSLQLLAKSVICSTVESTSGETHINTALQATDGEAEAYTLDWVSQLL